MTCFHSRVHLICRVLLLVLCKAFIVSHVDGIESVTSPNQPSRPVPIPIPTCNSQSNNLPLFAHNFLRILLQHLKLFYTTSQVLTV